MYRPVRGLWSLVAIGAATAVGITTHDAGFTALTFIGALALPRVLGLGGRRRWHGGGPSGHGCGPRWRERAEGGAPHAESHAGSASA
jgi:hypothetical protein